VKLRVKMRIRGRVRVVVHRGKWSYLNFNCIFYI